MAAPWYSHDVDSVPHAIDLAGSSLLALGALLLASLLYERGRRDLSAWLTLMAVLSLAAFELHAAGADTVAGLLSLSSAVCTVPLVVVGVAEGRRLRAGGSR